MSREGLVRCRIVEMDVRRMAGINNDGWAGGERVLALIPREATLIEKGEAAAHEPREPFMSHCPRPW
jgi:hypothetical protein